MRLSRKIGLAVAALCIMALVVAAAGAADTSGSTGPVQGPGQGHGTAGNADQQVQGSGQGRQLPPGQGHGNAGNTTQQGQGSGKGNNPPGQWPANPTGQGTDNPPGQWPGNPQGQGHGNAGNATQPQMGPGHEPRLGNGNVTNPGPGPGQGIRPGPGTGNATENRQRPGNGQGHPLLTPEILSRLEQMGYDVSEVRTALQNHDVNATRNWVDTFRKDNPGVLAGLEQANFGPGQGQGNVTRPGPGNGPWAGNVTQPGEGQAGPGSGQGNNPDNGQGSDQRPHILTPEFIQQLKQKGYDVNEVTTALRTWLSGFLKSGGNGTGTGSSQ